MESYLQRVSADERPILGEAAKLIEEYYSGKKVNIIELDENEVWIYYDSLPTLFALATLFGQLLAQREV